MNLQILSLFPQMITELHMHGVIGQALKKQLFSIEVINPRDFALGVHQAVDDKPFGGGAGMLMIPEPLEKCLTEIKSKFPETHVVFTSPSGKAWNQSRAREYVNQYSSVTIVCGRYEGVDRRWIEKNVDEEICIGNYILSGGELAASVMVDSMVRLLPGVLGNKISINTESFEGDGLLEPPQFTRPAEWQGLIVPEVLRSGDHKKIQEWNYGMSLISTYLHRGDIFEKLEGVRVKQELVKSLELALKMSEQELKSCGYESEQLEEILNQLKR